MGFPSRISRRAFGPTRRNRAPVRNHEFYLDAKYINLLMWQCAGMNVCSPRTMVFVNADGTLGASGEAWDPDGLVLPTPAHPSTGVYTVTYPATVQNEEGTEVALDLFGCLAIPQGTSTTVVAAQRVTSNRVAEVTIKDGASLADNAFLLLVW